MVKQGYMRRTVLTTPSSNACRAATALSDSITHRQLVYRLLPQKRSNWRWLARTLAAQRRLYNAALEERIDCYGKTGRGITYIDQFKSLTECRQDAPDMRSVAVAIQRGTLKRLDEAYRGFFRSGSGFPEFQSRRRWNSFSIVSGVKIEGIKIHIPAYGWMTVRRRGGNPHSEGTPLSAVLKLARGRWYVTVCYAIPVVEREDDGTSIGLDMNAGQVTSSTGVICCMPISNRLEARKRRYQRQIARQRKGSHRRRKTLSKLSKTTRRIANRRHNWQHHVSRRLSSQAHPVVIEDLKTKAMTASSKGTTGRNVKAKSGLNRVIRDTGRAALRQMLEDKAGQVISVNPAHTSQTGHACGTIDSRSRRSQAEFRCVHCGHADHADVNAARNILASGIGASARGGCRISGPENREIDTRLAA